MDIHRPAWLEQVEGVLETLNEGVIVTDDGARIPSVTITPSLRVSRTPSMKA